MAVSILINKSKLTFLGDRVAKYSGEHVHQIVRKQEAFAKEEYVKALQDGFIATDTALLEGVSSNLLSDFHLDRHYEDEPSGCTATAVLITEKNVLYVVWILCVTLLIPGKCRRFTDCTGPQGSRCSIIKRS
jgi:hypothetical protein